MHTSSLLGLGGFVPDRIVTNDDLAAIVDTDNEWIVSRTGIERRHFLEPGQSNAGLGHEASLRALKDAGVDPAALTHILYATCTPDEGTPAAACTLSHKLGLKNIFALDLNAACSGFLYGLVTARGLLAADPGALILLAAVDTLSTRCNWEDRSTCVLFGDGAGAAILGGVNRSGDKRLAALEDIVVSSDGSLGPLLQFSHNRGPGVPYALGDAVGSEYFVRMHGRDIFKHAVRNMAASCRQLLERNGLSMGDIDLFVPHQANLRIIEAVGGKLEADPAKVFVNVQERGNTSAASIPLALAEARDAGRLRPGMRVLLTTFGGGLTWGAALLRF